MFIQVIKSKVKDANALRAQVDKWTKDLAPGAKGWLGATEGVADDGTSIAVVRFESEEAAKANGDRPEQGTWWEETSKLFEGDVQFFNCPRVVEMMGGGSDDAGFVQVMMSKPKDIDSLLAASKQFEDQFPGMRPDFIGATTAVATDGTVIDTNYFTSEKEARAGEQQEMPEEVQEMMKGLAENVGPVEYIDLRDPWLFSP